jgi:D-glycero-alpha-D-manno-heptose-7-phosphate kinase
MLIVRSPVRISFAGGGTDLPAYYEQYDGAVVSAAINKYFYTILQKRGDGQIQVISSDLRVMESWDNILKTNPTETSLPIPLAALQALGCNGLALDIFMSSEIPPGTGLGSSASVAVNVLKALATYLHLSMSRYELAERAFHLARNVLGKPVGKQDEYAAAFGGLNYIGFFRDGSSKVDPVVLDNELLNELQANLLLFYTGASHDSWRILNEQQAATAMHVTTEPLHRVKQLAAQVTESLKRGALNEFGNLLHEGWQAKRRLSAHISNTRIDALYDLALANGALGGKITGAGGGGFLLIYCPREHQSRVREAFYREGIRDMTFRFDFQGAHVLVNDPFIDADDRCGTRWVFYTSRSPWSAPARQDSRSAQ